MFDISNREKDRNFLNLIIYQKFIANIILNDKILKMYSDGHQTTILLLPFLFNSLLDVLVSSQSLDKNNTFKDWKERKKS